MHFFLTGELQIGKSTLLRRALADFSGLRLGGFLTVTEADIPGEIGSVYIIPADDPSAPRSGHNRVGIRHGTSKGREAFPQAFDEAGVECLSGAEGAELIIMDEIGVMERTAERFTARVEELLDGGRPILGVLRKTSDTPLAERIRGHKNVRLVEVTQENRERLVEELRGFIGKELGK